VGNNSKIQQHHFYGSGWAFPVLFSAGNYRLAITAGEENINESINLILMTKQGERCHEPRFGSGLYRFVFKTMDDTLKGEIIDSVMMSLLQNEPRITVKEVSVEFTDRQSGLVEIHINYIYNQENSRHNHVFPFHLKEGTNLGH
jgi:uncharacterized protein